MQHPIRCTACGTTFYLPELPPVPTPVFCPKCRHVLHVVAPKKQVAWLTRTGIFVGTGAVVVVVGILVLNVLGPMFTGKRRAPVAVSTGAAASQPAASPEPVAPADIPRETPEAKLTRLLTDARSGDVRARQAAIRELARVPIVEARRAEDWQQVQTLLADPDPAIRAVALQVFPHWESKLDAALERLSALDDAPRRETIAALGVLKDESAIQLLIAIVQSNRRSSDLGSAIAALRQIGPAVEKSATPLLDHSSERVRLEICNLMRAVGSQASLPALRELSQKDPSTNVRNAAKAAARAIQDP